ncbi:MAG: hypothetical protein J0I77_16950 [Rudaea sp.]|uniref:hypothetical protein n=1 Tax=unclassified Rudaea TaxID=2627037 RepID=UPI001485651A|nr:MULTISPECIES: hypothetical protein [unclassified Rudaea]MBN8887414.1 hypothetical protein [Rudaea sp.]MBR0347545.1 hypothetical protein [Rudaea sp.]
MMSGIATGAKPQSTSAAAQSGSDALVRCARLIADQAPAAASLARIESMTQFLAALDEFARAHGIVLDADDREQVLAGRRIDRVELRHAWSLPARRGWLPVGVEFGVGGVELVWACGAARAGDSFYEQAVQSLRLRPLNRLFSVRTPLSEEFIAALAADALPLRGLIFHMSRCGSTLIAQGLKAWPGVRVISEPGVLDTAIMLAASGYDADWKVFRGVLSALSQPAGNDESVVIKTDAWHALALAPLLERARVPWLFAYRDPVEVLVSHAREPGRHTVSGMLPEAWFGGAGPDGVPLPPIDYAARALGAICASIVAHAHTGTLVNYSELPQALQTRVPSLFGLDPQHVDRNVFASILALDAKRPYEKFSDDRAAKQEAAGAALRDAAAKWIAPHYASLERIRLGVEAG